MKKIIVGLGIWIVVGISCNNDPGSPVKARAAINHVAIYVVKVATSASFYENIIGLDSVPEPFHDGKHKWFAIGPHTMLHIIEGADTAKTYYKNNHICFRVNSVEAFTVVLRKAGIPWEDRDGQQQAVTTRVDGVQQIWLQDPDGYWLEINDDKY